MTLLGAILRKVQSRESFTRKYTSPPPETEEISSSKRKRITDKYAFVKATVDSKPPTYDCQRLYRNGAKWRRSAFKMAAENACLIMAIRLSQLNRGKVDNHWKRRLPANKVRYCNRVNFLKQLQIDNKIMYNLIMRAGNDASLITGQNDGPSYRSFWLILKTFTKYDLRYFSDTKCHKTLFIQHPRVRTTKMLECDWRTNRRVIIQRAHNKFVLFPPVPEDLIEDAAFKKPSGVIRPRAYLTIRIRGGAVIGELKVELFEDVCPETCRLFLELLDGESGYGYVGTKFFSKVPGLFWRGGDVVYDNGYGCYAQRGRSVPVGAENYHFPHSMPGLLSMRVSCDNEVCGNFNITFKPLPQFDLRNVVFGRIVRPCKVFDAIRGIGNSLSVYPVAELSSARRLVNGKWRSGTKNSELPVKQRQIKV